MAISLEILATANRLLAAQGRAPCFEAALVGSGRGAAWALVPFGLPLGGRAGTEAEVLVVPGLGFASETEIDARLADRDASRLMERLRQAAVRGAEITASCSAVFLLAGAGLLAGRRLTTSWWLAPLLARRHPDARVDADALLVQDGAITTGGAALAQIDLMLHLVSQHAGPELASACARYLLLDRLGSQSRYMAVAFLAASDPEVARAERFARSRLGEGLTVAELAGASGLGERTFSRRLKCITGLSPVRFLQRLRVEHARELLATSRLSIEIVAERVG